MADPVNGRMKAFLVVGVAYFLTAILAPIAILSAKGSSAAFWSYPDKGFWWSLLAGTVGAVGALGVLLAFGAAPNPKAAYVPVVMSIIFAGAPIVNALVSTILHPPAGGWGSIKPQFFIGLALAAAGAAMVTYYKPEPGPAKPTVTASAPISPSAPAAK